MKANFLNELRRTNEQKCVVEKKKKNVNEEKNSLIFMFTVIY